MIARVRWSVRRFGWWQWTLTGVFVLALVLTALLAIRTVQYTLYWRAHQRAPIERWMTVNYVARSYSVPPGVLWEALGLPEPPRDTPRRDRHPLGVIAATQGKSFDEVNAALLAAIARYRPSDTPTPPAPSPTPRTDRGGP